MVQCLVSGHAVNPSLGARARLWPRPPSRAVPALTLPVSHGPDINEFFYGPNRNRYRRVERISGVVVEEALYIGNTEIIEKDGRREYRRSIAGIAIDHFYLNINGTSSHRIDYVLRDHLGSPHTLLDDLARTFHQGSGICAVAGETVWLIVRRSIAIAMV